MGTPKVELLVGIFGNESFFWKFLLKSGKMFYVCMETVNKRLVNGKIIALLIISNRLNNITEDKM